MHLIAGVLLLVTGGGVFSGNALARVAATVLAGLNALAQLTFLPAFPLWSLLVIVLDVVVIAALLIRGTGPGPRAELGRDRGSCSLRARIGSEAERRLSVMVVIPHQSVGDVRTLATIPVALRHGLTRRG